MSLPETHMRTLLSIAIALAACTEPPQDQESTVESAIGTSYQGTSYQGSSFLGTIFIGTSYQGTSYQGTSYQGTASSGGAFTSVTVSGTGITTWSRRSDGTWDQRTPTTLSHWDPLKLFLLDRTVVTLGSQPSPLAGSTFAATFSNGLTGHIRIGTSASEKGAVLLDTTTTMYPVGTGAAVPYGPSCGNPLGCRVNSDLYTYELYVLDGANAYPFCPAGERALALAGTWDSTGQHTTTSGQFTFACTNGTIAKCTRWGYRPWASATKSDGSGPFALADYHQACIRAATADYCANGHSFTKDGTLVDLFDYNYATGSSSGFIPSTGSVEWHYGRNSTAFLNEATFDSHGATSIEFMRYVELGNTPYGSIDDGTNGCPGLFPLVAAPMPDEPQQYRGRSAPAPTAPTVGIASSPACAHSDMQAGKWLHPECSDCAYELWRLHPTGYHCISANGSWNASCVADANAVCGASGQSYKRNAAHSECVAGGALYQYATGCTASVCNDPAYAGCCTSGWTTSCVALANNICHGGLESWPNGFCGSPISIQIGG